MIRIDIVVLHQGGKVRLLTAGLLLLFYFYCDNFVCFFFVQSILPSSLVVLHHHSFTALFSCIGILSYMHSSTAAIAVAGGRKSHIEMNLSYKHCINIRVI